MNDSTGSSGLPGLGIIEADGVTDIFAAAGIELPDLTQLDEAFLKRLRESKTPNLAIEALRRLVEQTMRRTTRRDSRATIWATRAGGVGRSLGCRPI